MELKGDTGVQTNIIRTNSSMSTLQQGPVKGVRLREMSGLYGGLPRERIDCISEQRAFPFDHAHVQLNT